MVVCIYIGSTLEIRYRKIGRKSKVEERKRARKGRKKDRIGEAGKEGREEKEKRKTKRGGRGQKYMFKFLGPLKCKKKFTY